jgi:hypothetical protein
MPQYCESARPPTTPRLPDDVAAFQRQALASLDCICRRSKTIFVKSYRTDWTKIEFLLVTGRRATVED